MVADRCVPRPLADAPDGYLPKYPIYLEEPTTSCVMQMYVDGFEMTFDEDLMAFDQDTIAFPGRRRALPRRRHGTKGAGGFSHGRDRLW